MSSHLQTPVFGFHFILRIHLRVYMSLMDVKRWFLHFPEDTHANLSLSENIIP